MSDNIPDKNSSSKAFNWIKEAMRNEYGKRWFTMTIEEQLASISVFMKNYYSLIVKSGKIYEQ